MAEVKHFPQAGQYATRDNAARKVVSAELPAASAEKYCVYNQTRERFVATGVEAVGTSHGGAEVRLRSLQPGAGTGLWILPCPEISPTSIRVPVDLVYLNSDGAVLVTVQSFPLGGPAVSSAIAGSLLVLPENTVTEGEIHVGDRMVVAAPDEMKRHLQSMKDAKAAAQESSSNFLDQFLLPSPGQQAAHGPGDPLQPATQFPSSAFVPTPYAFAPLSAASVAFAPAKTEIAGAEPLAQPAPAPSAPVDPEAWKKKKQPKGWLARLLKFEPDDPRSTSRQSLPGLIAYYFTGGKPVGHQVRDISPTGMYIVTEERWYPGTVIRVTLTDRHNPTHERSITVNAKAVRWGADGVGLEFVLEASDRPSLNGARMERANGMNPAEIEEFLRIYESPSQ